MIIALNPRVLLMPHVRRIVSRVDGAHMIHNGVQREPEVTVGILFLGHKRRHIELDGELDKRGNLAIDQSRVLETFQMEGNNAGQSAQAKLFGGLLIGFASGTLDFRRRTEMLGSCIPLQAVD